MQKRNKFYCYAKWEEDQTPLLIYQCNTTGAFKVIKALSEYTAPLPLQGHLKLAQHIKGGLYFILGYSLFEGVEVTIYQSQVDHQVWVRATEIFNKRFKVYG